MDDLEVLVIDDASSDETVSIAREYAARDSRVSVQVNSQRLGLVQNWNRAVSSAKGEWIKLLFQDDLLAPTCLEKMTAVKDSVMVVCDRALDVADSATDSTENYIAGLPTMDELFGGGLAVSNDQICEALVKHPGVNFFGEPSAMLLHRTVFERFGDFNSGMIQLCDLEFWARVASQVGMGRVREELATFRIHGKSASSVNYDTRQFQKDVLDTLILYHEFAFAPQFAALRSKAGGGFSALAARELQRARANVTSYPDLPLGDALEGVLNSYPKLRSRVWQFWERVRKQLPLQS